MGWKWYLVLTISEEPRLPSMLVISNDIQPISMLVL